MNKQTFTPEQMQIRRDRANKWNKDNARRFKQNRSLHYLKNKEKLISISIENQRKNPQDNIARVNKCIKDKPWYHCWTGAKQRCTNPNHPRFDRYGGRGIKFSLSQADMIFMWQRDKANEMRYPSIDRKDNNGDYTLDNCQFLDKGVHARKTWAVDRAGRN